MSNNLTHYLLDYGGIAMSPHMFWKPKFRPKFFKGQEFSVKMFEQWIFFILNGLWPDFKRINPIFFKCLTDLCPMYP